MRRLIAKTTGSIVDAAAFSLVLLMLSGCRDHPEKAQTVRAAPETPAPSPAPEPPAPAPAPTPAVHSQLPAVPDSQPLPIVPAPPAPAAQPPEASSSTVPGAEPFVVSQCDPADALLPGPERAAAAAGRVRPALEKDLAAKGLRFGDPLFLRAFKREGELEMWLLNRKTRKYDLFRTWKIAAASGKPGPKLSEGDNQVPEGFYHVPRSAMKPDSTFHLAFNIGYPNDYDRAHQRTGSFIMIHGNRVSIGCLAMTDEKIEEIYTLCDAALAKGQPYFRVHIFPFRMTAEHMAQSPDPRWTDFWQNLKEGYDLFEKTHLPPETSVSHGRYAFKQ